MSTTFEQFIRHRTYVDNYSPKTISIYRQAWKTFTKLVGEAISQESLKDYVVKMRESGISPATCNVYIKGMNGFLIWLHEFEYIAEPLRIKILKCEKKVIKPFSDSQLQAIISFRPKSFCEARLHAVCCLLADVGVRIDEALSLTRTQIDFDNLLVRIKGKGSKERLIPFTVECRRILSRFLQRHSFDLAFPTRNGTRYSYINFYRDFRNLGKRLGIEGVRVSAHTVRHSFARRYLKEGGNVFYLQRMLGHTNVQTTQRYVDVDTEDLQRVQARTSILSRLR